MKSIQSDKFKGFSHSTKTLPGGLTIVQVHQPHLHRASVAVYFRVGSRFESAGDNGLSHFLEHMIFRGSSNFPTAYELNVAVESLGGSLFAATSPDTTEFEMTLPGESVINGINLLAEVVTRPAFKEIEIERKVIIEEIREDLSEDGDSIDIDFLSRKRVWAENALGQSVLGPIENALAFNQEDIERHFAKNYIAPNAVVCITGNYDQKQVEPVLESAFGGLPVGQKTTVNTPILETGSSTLHVKKPGSQTSVRISFRAVGDDDPDRAALSILLGILDDGMSTRLHRRIFEELGLAYNVSADLDSYQDSSSFNIDALTSHDNVVEICKQILGLLTELRDNPIEQLELEKAKNRAIWWLEEFLDDPHAMSGWYGEQALFRTPVDIETRAKTLAQIEIPDLVRVAQRIFTANNLHLTTVGVVNNNTKKKIDALVQRF